MPIAAFLIIYFDEPKETVYSQKEVDERIKTKDVKEVWHLSFITGFEEKIYEKYYTNAI